MQINKPLWHISKTRDKNHTICTIDTEHILDKIQYPFTIETVKNLGIEET
jgi:hypothetical protein